MGQDDGWLPFVRGSRGVGRVDLHRVMSAALQAVDLLVGHALGQPRKLGVLVEEVHAIEMAVLGGKGLHLAVHRVSEGMQQRSSDVASEQAVPIAYAHQLDDLPDCTGTE